MSIFKDKKIPKHLIIHDEYEVRRRSKLNLSKLLFLGLLLASLAYVIVINNSNF